jgi:hypothetical protein
MISVANVKTNEAVTASQMVIMIQVPGVAQVKHADVINVKRLLCALIDTIYPFK